jgi:hypothetical protein
MTLFNKELLSGPYSDYVGDLIDNDQLFKKLPTQLLTFNNAKTPKGEELGYLTAILYFAPYMLSGYQMCKFAELAQCHGPCLNTAGRGKFDATQKARIRKTLMFHQFRPEFMVLLVSEINRAIRKSKRMGLKLVVRLNGTSDIVWENTPVVFNKTDPTVPVYSFNIFELFPTLTFYDYSKYPTRHKLPNNYHLTFSYSGAASFNPIVDKWIAKRTNQNMAVVFKTKPSVENSKVILESGYKLLGVIDGDSNDLRFLDSDNVVVGLTAKGKAKTDTTGFVVRAV